MSCEYAEEMGFKEWLEEFFKSTKFTFIDNFDQEEKIRIRGALWAIETIIEYYKIFENNKDAK